MDFINEDLHKLINIDEVDYIKARIEGLINRCGKEEVPTILCSSSTALLLYTFRKELGIENDISMKRGMFVFNGQYIEIDENFEFGDVMTCYELL